jgi:hypothetical protein
MQSLRTPRIKASIHYRFKLTEREDDYMLTRLLAQSLNYVVIGNIIIKIPFPISFFQPIFEQAPYRKFAGRAFTGGA